jgi:hypothetical protein
MPAILSRGQNPNSGVAPPLLMPVSNAVVGNLNAASLANDSGSHAGDGVANQSISLSELTGLPNMGGDNEENGDDGGEEVQKSLSLFKKKKLED